MNSAPSALVIPLPSDMHSLLTNREARLIIRYLDGVDELVGNRIVSAYRLDEDALTIDLCEMLDRRMSRYHALPFSQDDLHRELEAEPRGISVDLTIESTMYSKYVERHSTSADLGVVLTYTDHAAGISLERGALLQAKRIYPDADGTFSLQSKFGAFDWKQFVSLANLVPID